MEHQAGKEEEELGADVEQYKGGFGEQGSSEDRERAETAEEGLIRRARAKRPDRHHWSRLMWLYPDSRL